MMILFFALFARAEVSLPTIRATDFQVGQSWTWDYTEANGKIYSTERYTVVDLQGTTVLLEIASDYNGGQNLKPNTRVKADVAKCLAAYSNPHQKKPWSITMYSHTANGWSEFEAPSTLAFEEKFNCNPREYRKPSDQYLTEYSVVDGVKVFQQKLWRKLVSSWFAQEGTARAVAVQKEFTSDPAMTYRFKLRDFAK
jgi:hypothetical protein